MSFCLLTAILFVSFSFHLALSTAPRTSCRLVWDQRTSTLIPRLTYSSGPPTLRCATITRLPSFTFGKRRSHLDLYAYSYDMVIIVFCVCGFKWLDHYSLLIIMLFNF